MKFKNWLIKMTAATVLLVILCLVAFGAFARDGKLYTDVFRSSRTVFPVYRVQLQRHLGVDRTLFVTQSKEECQNFFLTNMEYYKNRK